MRVEKPTVAVVASSDELFACSVSEIQLMSPLAPATLQSPKVAVAATSAHSLFGGPTTAAVVASCSTTTNVRWANDSPNLLAASTTPVGAGAGDFSINAKHQINNFKRTVLLSKR